MAVLFDHHYLFGVEELAYHIAADVLSELLLNDEDGKILVDKEGLAKGIDAETLTEGLNSWVLEDVVEGAVLLKIVISIFGALFDVELIFLMFFGEQQVKYADFELFVYPSITDVPVNQRLILICNNLHVELRLF